MMTLEGSAKERRERTRHSAGGIEEALRSGSWDQLDLSPNEKNRGSNGIGSRLGSRGRAGGLGQLALAAGRVKPPPTVVAENLVQSIVEADPDAARRERTRCSVVGCNDAPRSRTRDPTVTSFAPGAGASELTFMISRVPLLLRRSLARMHSMARSKLTIGGRQLAEADPAGWPQVMLALSTSEAQSRGRFARQQRTQCS